MPRYPVTLTDTCSTHKTQVKRHKHTLTQIPTQTNTQTQIETGRHSDTHKKTHTNTSSQTHKHTDAHTTHGFVLASGFLRRSLTRALRSVQLGEGCPPECEVGAHTLTSSVRLEDPTVW